MSLNSALLKVTSRLVSIEILVGAGNRASPTVQLLPYHGKLALTIYLSVVWDTNVGIYMKTHHSPQYLQPD